jgi:carboxyl-terminal processing protease
MRTKTLVVFASILIVLLIAALACSGGYVLGRTSTLSSLWTIPPARQFGTPSSSGQEPVDLETLFSPFWEAWDIVHEQYVTQPVDDEALVQGAIRGMLEALEDPHTSYMDPEQFHEATISLDQEYEGIGAWVDPDGEYLTIVSPMPGSPAEEVGLRPGDKVIGIDGNDMTGIDGNVVRQRVLGPAGSTVVLTIQRDLGPGAGSEIFDVEVTRSRITIPSIEHEMLEGNIAYIKLYQFGDRGRNDLRQGLTELMRQNPDGLIFDLRFNGGGYLHTAIEVASEFIGNGVILYEVYGDGSRDTYNALRGGKATDIPLIVLINEGSASASEIVAGAIQDHERGLLVGAKSFGKGSVQNWPALSNDQGAVRITIAYWLTPNERQIHEIGLTPDVEVPLTDEDVAAGRDPQLEKAIELLLNH